MATTGIFSDYASPTPGQTIYVDFYVLDGIQDIPVPGRTLGDWEVVFKFNLSPCGLPLSLVDHGDGRYTVSYTVISAGHYYLSIYDPLYNTSTIDIEDISDLV